MSTEKRLYTVEIKTVVVVVADNRVEAERIADGIDDERLDLHVRAADLSHFPAGWNGDEIPYGKNDTNDPDRTIDEWIELGAAPLVAEFRARLDADRQG